jgi:site-specific recombinase XerD
LSRAYISTVDTKTDRWEVPYQSSYGDKLSFEFSYLPNKWFKKIHKQITIECMSLGKPSVETLYRYNYSLKRFFEFLKEYNLKIMDYADLSHQITQMYIYYLQQIHLANSTRSVAMSALKWVVEHGQFFEYDGFPEGQVFDGDEYQALKQDDVLRTRYIPDNEMEQIEIALKKENNILLKSIVEIGIDSGIRLSEVLDLTEGCITEDFTGKPVLYVFSPKNKADRYIPVSNRVKRAVQLLEQYSEVARKELATNYICLYWQKRNIRYARLLQKIFRDKLYRFVKKHDIRDNDGELYPLTFHAFRHTLGTDMLNKGMSMFEIQEYLGHESLHSTSLYAKVQNPKVESEYKKLGFIGMIVKEINEKELGQGKNLDTETLLSASLPDGACQKPINNEGKICSKFNMCVICPKFITTPEHLPIHKDHLDRLRANREAYMAQEYIGTTNHLETVEYALETIIGRLEAMQSG